MESILFKSLIKKKGISMLKNDEDNKVVGSNTNGLRLKTNVGNKSLEGKKPCPHCDRVIDEEDRVCMHCGFDLKKGKTVKELNKPSLISLKLVVAVTVIIGSVGGIYLYRQQVSEFIDEKAGTNLAEQVKKYAPVASAEEGESDSVLSKKIVSGVVNDAQEGGDQLSDEVGSSKQVVEADNAVVNNPFRSLDSEELTYKKEDLTSELADLKEEVKQALLDYRASAKELSQAKKGYQLSLSKAAKYKAAYMDKTKPRDKRMDYKERYVQYAREAKDYKQEYQDLLKDVKELKAQIKAPKDSLAKKTLELKQVNDAIKSKN
jgi:hypothetical protein